MSAQISVERVVLVNRMNFSSYVDWPEEKLLPANPGQVLKIIWAARCSNIGQ
jgi:hypothetical protein